MPWRGYPYYDLSAGIHREVSANDPDYPKGGLWDLVNMVYTRDQQMPETMEGATLLGSLGGMAVSGLFDYDEGAALVACSEDGRIYEYTGSGFSVATGGTSYSPTADVRWSGHMFYGATTAANLLILGNGVNAPVRYDPTNGVVALGGDAPTLGQYPVPFVGRLWMAQGATLFYSKVDDVETFTPPGGSIHVHRASGDITGLTTFAGNLFIFKRRAIFRLPAGPLSSSALLPVSTSVGAISHDTIREIPTESAQGLAFLAEDGVRAVIPSGEHFRTPSISGPVKPLLDRRASLRTSWADFNKARAEYWLQYGISQATPERGLICNTARSWRDLRWTQHTIDSLTAGTTWRASGQGEAQVVGDSSGNVLQMQSGDYAWASAGYPSRLQTASMTQGAPHLMKEYNRAFVDVETERNYPVTVRLGCGRRDLPRPAGSSEDLTLGESEGWGTGTWGDARWGGSGVAGDYIRYSSVGRGAFTRIIVSTTGPDQWVRIKGFVVEAETTSDSIVEA